MSIINPYQGVEHKVFNRTFLQETKVGVEIEPQMTLNDFRTCIVSFVEKAFNQDISNELGNAIEQIEVASSNKQIKFVFNTNSACVTIRPAAYRSFSLSVTPQISVLLNYLKEVARTNQIKLAYINKVNVWPIKSENSKQTFSRAALFIFKKEHIADIANLNFDESDYPVSATKEAVIKCGETSSLRAKIGVELSDAASTCFILNLQAQTSNIETDNVIPDLLKLNDVIFGAFMDVISPNVSELMSK